MRACRFAIAAALCFGATVAQAAGVQFVDVPADAEGPALTGAVWSPCAAPARDVMLGRLIVPGVPDCPIAGDKLPLVVVSHGRRGLFSGHHDTVETLADAGFVVAAINHPGDNATDTSRTDDLSVLIERPADIKRLVDFMLGAWPDASLSIVSVSGFSAFPGVAIPASSRSAASPISTDSPLHARRDGRAVYASKSAITKSRLSH
jgi:predicted dienelactone hydrolase